MPEYLTPGVYVEETSFRSRSIEGVATSTFGMAGVTRYGPVPYVVTPPNSDLVVMVPSPTLVTSFTEFERAFGGVEDVAGDVNYLAYAARAFFAQGGRRLYVSRTFPFTRDNTGAVDVGADFASLPVGDPAVATWRARWPGAAGKGFTVKVDFQRSKNRLIGGVLIGVGPGAAVELFPNADDVPPERDPQTRRPVPPNPANVRVVGRDAEGKLGLVNDQGDVEPIPANDPRAACHVTVIVSVRWGERRTDVYPGLELGDHPRAVWRVLQAPDPADEFSLVWLDVGAAPAAVRDLLGALLTLGSEQFLRGGSDGAALDTDAIKGEPADPDDFKKAATGLAALADVEDIAIVATPDSVRFSDAEQKTAIDNLIGHCEALKAYRIGIVDPPRDCSISQVRRFRSQFDTTYAALYYPWVEIIDPTQKVDPGAAPAVSTLR